MSFPNNFSGFLKENTNHEFPGYNSLVKVWAFHPKITGSFLDKKISSDCW